VTRNEAYGGCLIKGTQVRNFCLYVFDLDGTLADTAADIAAGVNYALGRLGAGTASPERVRSFVGDGTRVLLRRALLLFREDVSDAEVDEAVRLHLDYYLAHLCDRTTLYPNVRETLPVLPGIKTVVTNKPTEASVQILQRLGVAHQFSAICGADAFPRAKPDAMPIVAMAHRFHADPGRTLVVGDGPQDIEAGKRAGARTCAVAYGFRGPEVLRPLSPDYLISDFAELRDLTARTTA